MGFYVVLDVVQLAYMSYNVLFGWLICCPISLYPVGLYGIYNDWLGLYFVWLAYMQFSGLMGYMVCFYVGKLAYMLPGLHKYSSVGLWVIWFAFILAIWLICSPVSFYVGKLAYVLLLGLDIS